MYNAHLWFSLDHLESSLRHPKIGLLVVGMHRSGTSATAKLLNILGAALPGNLMPPHSEINAKGFWESYDIASLNDALLSSHHSRWDDVLSIPVDDSDQQTTLNFESKATELLERDFSDADLFVLKDPRICRLLPYWLRVFKHLSIEPRVVIPVRHPLEVAASLNRRDKFQKEKAIYLWLRHLVDAERASRNVPRSFLLYDDMLGNWRATVDRLSSDLNIRWPIAPDTVKREADAFLDVQLRHHRSSTFRQNSDDLIANLSKELYSKLQSGDHDISSLVDSIHAGLYPSEKLLAPILQDISGRYEHSVHLLGETKQLASRLQSDFVTAQSLLTERNAELAATRQHFDALSAEFETKCQHVNQLAGEAAQLQEALVTTQSVLEVRDAELDSARQHFHQLNAEFEAKCQHVNQLTDEASQLKEALANTQSVLGARNAELSNTHLALSVADSSIAALHAEKTDAAAHLCTLSDDIRSAIFQTDRTNTGRIFMSQQAEPNQSIQSALESLQSQTDRIVALTRVNDTLLQGSTDKLMEADRAIRNLLAPQLKKNIRRDFFRKRSKSAQLLQDSPLFDAAFYVSSHAEALASELTPYEHYLKIGASKGWDPHPVFSTHWYLEQNRDVAQSGMNPLVHFLRNGAKEGRSPHPLFDTAHYLKTYPQVASSGMNSLEHYLHAGAQAGFRPHALFDGEAYMDNYPEVRTMGMNPLVHYLQFGHLRNYRPHWAFDPIHYLIDNPGVAGTGTSPLVHFITKGAKQRRNPSAEFDTAGFIAQYPFLEHSSENPLAYYVSNVNPQGAPAPVAQSQEEAAFVPATPIHNEEPGQPLPAFMDFLWDEFGDPIRMDIVTRMQRFHLPFTSDKLTPKPSAQEIETWLAEIASMSEAMGDLAQPDVSIVVPVYNQLAFTLACLHSVLSSNTRYSYEIIVADDRSTDRTTEIFSNGVGRVRHVLSEQNQGFIRNCNTAAKQAKGRYLVLLNNDTIVMPGWLDELIEPLDKHPDIGLVGSKLLYPDGRLQESGGIIFGDGSGWNYGRMDDPRKPQYCYMRDSDYVSGASIALRTDFWHGQGGFDELYSVAYYEDTDMAFRVRKAGLRVVVQPLSQLLHFEGISSGTDTSSGAKQYQITNGVIFREKWNTVLADHPLCDPDRLPVNRTARGRVLVIDACTPTPDRDSGSMDTFQYLRILKSFGLHVTFVPDNLAYFGSYTQDLQRIGVETLYAPYWMSHEEVFKKLGSTFDLVLIYRVSIASRLLKLVRSHAPQAKLIFDTVDLHFLREEREAELTGDPEKLLSAANTRKTELNVISKADATIILSNHEMDVVHKLLPKARLYEIPIVREIPGRGPLGFAERNDIVFIGGFRHAPNLDAVKWFVSEVWPILRSKGFTGNFQIVGSDMPPEITALHGSGIVIRGHVPVIDDVFHSVRLSIAPLRYGAGLKGKVISSLSFGVPVVATSVAVEGGGFIHKRHVKVADEPEAFADAIIRLYENREIWENLSEHGLGHCDQSFSVSAVSAKLHDMINDIAPELIHGK